MAPATRAEIQAHNKKADRLTRLRVPSGHATRQ